VKLSLQGTLDTFSVADVLPVLERGSKTGALRVRGETGSGILHLVGGRLHGAESEALRGAVASDDELRTRLLDVCFVLFREHRGSFEFDDSWRPPAGSALTGVGVDDVLVEVGRVVAEWSANDRGGLDFEARVSLVGELAGETVTLDRHSWRAVRAVGPTSTLREVAAALGLSVVETAVALRVLTEDGILTVGGAADAADAESAVDALSSLRADRGFASGPVTPAPFDPAAFDPARYDPAEHEPLEWSAQPGNSGYAAAHAGDASLRADIAADIAALEAAARDLGAREKSDDPTDFRPDRTSAFARLASERTEAEMQAQGEAEEAAQRAGFTLAVGDLDLLPASRDLTAELSDPGAATYDPAVYDPATYDPATYDPAEFDPDAYAPLAFEPSAPTSYAGGTAGDGGYGSGDVGDPEARYLAPEFDQPLPGGGSGFDDRADGPGEGDLDEAAADLGVDAAGQAVEPDAPRIGEPKDRGALLRMFSALREG
jgi:hypothetical protein